MIDLYFVINVVTFFTHLQKQMWGKFTYARNLNFMCKFLKYTRKGVKFMKNITVRRAVKVEATAWWIIF